MWCRLDRSSFYILWLWLHWYSQAGDRRQDTKWLFPGSSTACIVLLTLRDNGFGAVRYKIRMDFNPWTLLPKMQHWLRFFSFLFFLANGRHRNVGCRVGFVIWPYINNRERPEAVAKLLMRSVRRALRDNTLRLFMIWISIWRKWFLEVLLLSDIFFASGG